MTEKEIINEFITKLSKAGEDFIVKYTNGQVTYISALGLSIKLSEDTVIFGYSDVSFEEFSTLPSEISMVAELINKLKNARKD